MIDLHAIYMETESGRWNATIHNHPYIQVKDAEDLSTAQMLLRLYAAEELGAKYSPRRIDWNIDTETINRRTRGLGPFSEGSKNQRSQRWTTETDTTYSYCS